MLDVSELLLDLRLRDRLVAIGHQVDQVRFLGVEAAKLGCELPVEKSAGCFLVFERLAHMGTDFSDKHRIKPDGGIVSLDSVFHMDDIDVRA